MKAVPTFTERIIVDDDLVRAVKAVDVDAQAAFTAHNPDGEDIEIPSAVAELLSKMLSAMAQHGSATITSISAELTSTVAADVLGVSRPTVLKWASDGKLPSYKIGTHTRFERSAVLNFKALRSAEQREAFAQLRDLDLRNHEHLSE